MSDPILLEVGKRYKFKIQPFSFFIGNSWKLFKLYDRNTRIRNYTTDCMIIVGTVVRFAGENSIILKDIEYL